MKGRFNTRSANDSLLGYSTFTKRVCRRTLTVVGSAFIAALISGVPGVRSTGHAADGPTTELPPSVMTALLGLDVVTGGQSATTQRSLPGSAGHEWKVAAQRLMITTAANIDERAVVLTKITSERAEEVVQAKQQSGSSSPSVNEALARYAEAERLLAQVKLLLQETPTGRSGGESRLKGIQKRDEAQLAQLLTRLEQEMKPALDQARTDAEQHGNELEASEVPEADETPEADEAPEPEETPEAKETPEPKKAPESKKAPPTREDTDKRAPRATSTGSARD